MPRNTTNKNEAKLKTYLAKQKKLERKNKTRKKPDDNSEHNDNFAELYRKFDLTL